MRMSHLALTLALRKAIQAHPDRRVPRAMQVRSVQRDLLVLQVRRVIKGRQVRPARASG
jgi:hypothetical protein